MSALATIQARTCEGCGAVQARHDDLHLCGCEDQQNLCRPCREACAAKLREDDMSEPTKEVAAIPGAMLATAARRLYEREGHDYAEKDRALERGYWKEAEWQAKAVLEAAGVPALLEQVASMQAWRDSESGEKANLLAQIADYEAAYRKVMAEQCAPDERHCTCVPHLKRRIAELEADGERLRFLITESGMDGFDGHDALDFIEFVASERCHEEPTDEDELDGWRRLLDVARKAQASAGGGK